MPFFDPNLNDHYYYSNRPIIREFKLSDLLRGEITNQDKTQLLNFLKNESRTIRTATATLTLDHENNEVNKQILFNSLAVFVTTFIALPNQFLLENKNIKIALKSTQLSSWVEEYILAGKMQSKTINIVTCDIVARSNHNDYYSELIKKHYSGFITNYYPWLLETISKIGLHLKAINIEFLKISTDEWKALVNCTKNFPNCRFKVLMLEVSEQHLPSFLKYFANEFDNDNWDNLDKNDSLEAPVLDTNTNIDTKNHKLLPNLSAIFSSIRIRNLILKKLEENKNISEINKKNPNELNLSNCFLGDKHIQTILTYLKANENIQSLLLTNNEHLTQIGLNNLFEGLQAIPWITSLDLQNVPNISDAFETLNQYLAKNLLLKLNISYAKLKDIHLTQIIELIRTNRSLYFLDIRANNFTPIHNQLLAKALCDNHTLTNFYFDTISNDQELEAFIFEIGWTTRQKKGNLKKTKNPNYRLEELQIKQKERQIDGFYKAMTYGKQERNKLASELTALAQMGNDISKFRELLSKSCSPYTLAQEGFLQHLLVDCKDDAFLDCLFKSYNINPWLRFQGKTILDLANEKNKPNLLKKIEARINELKNPKSITPILQMHTTPNSTLLKKRKSEEIINKSDVKKIKIDENNATATFTAFSPSNTTLTTATTTTTTTTTDTLQLSESHNEQNIPLIEPKSTAFFPTDKTSNVMLIMQLISTEQDTVLKTRWHSSLRAEFISMIQKTPLQFAIDIKSIKSIKMLTILGENINERPSNDLSLLFHFINRFSEKKHSEAEVDQYISLLQVLIKCGADVSAKVTTSTASQDTVLHLAVRMGNYRTVKMLLEHPNCLLNHTSSTNSTPLMEAVKMKEFKIAARLLLDRRHTRTTVLNALNLADRLKFEEIKVLLKDHLETYSEETKTSGLQWSRGLQVHFKKPALGNKPIHTISLDKEHAWLHTQNDFTRQCLTISDLEERMKKLKELGNPVTASITFVMTAEPHIRHRNSRFVDITIPLQDIPNFHLTDVFSDNTISTISNAERKAVIETQKVLTFLPHYQNYRNGYAIKSTKDVQTAHVVDFAQTYRHGERSFVTYLSQEHHIRNLVELLTKQPGFIQNAKCIGIILNIASPRYVCENCEIALLASQNPETSQFLTLVSDELRQASVHVSRFNSIRMITCVSSFIPFHSEAISIGGTQLLNIDFRDKDVILAKDIGQVAKEGAYTQFKSNQVL